jgi:hypothetical protein
VPSVGIGARAGFSRLDAKSQYGQFYPRSNQTLAITGQVIPRITYFFGKRMFLDANIPVSLIYQDYKVSTNKNPHIPAKYQTISNFNLSTFPPFFALRIGVGVKL